jgi:hypothetical protein
MIDIEQINIAIKVAGEEYRNGKGVVLVKGISGLLSEHRTLCREVLRLSEQYLNDNISDPEVLQESLNCLRAHIRLDEDYTRKELVQQYFTSSSQFN